MKIYILRLNVLQKNGPRADNNILVMRVYVSKKYLLQKCDNQ